VYAVQCLRYDERLRVVRKTPFLRRVILKPDQFTKTGSKRTSEKLRKKYRMRCLQGALVALPPCAPLLGCGKRPCLAALCFS
jgi:hypothetical protein